MLPNTTPRGRLARLTLLTWALASLAVSALLVAGVLDLSLVSAGTLADIWTFDLTSRVPVVCALVWLVLLTAAAVVALVTDELRAGIWVQQVGIGWGVVALNSFLAMATITLLAADQAMFTWFWVIIGSVFFVERVVTVWRAGWTGRLLAVPIIIELAYDLFLQAVFVKSIFDIATAGKPGGQRHPCRRRRPRSRS